LWDDGVNSGEFRVGQEGMFIEEFEFADGSTYTYDELLLLA
jgi:hypothetical protein